MKLFRSRGADYTDRDLAASLEPFDLAGRPVLLYSRILSFGRMLSESAIDRLLEVLLEAVGPAGTLCIPAYTFSTFRDEPFDPERSKSRVGVLGDVARARPGFVRTLHPVYSTVCAGSHATHLLEQRPQTCFGPGSFFDLFAGLPGASVLMLGTNLSAVTMAHYYDQMFGAPGRFLKKFSGRVVDNGREVALEFDSFVKDYEFYGDRMPCLGRLDVVAAELGLLRRAPSMGDWIHGIRETDLRRLYEACVKVDPEYFLLASTEEFRNYYEKNEFDLFHGAVEADRIEAVARCMS